MSSRPSSCASRRRSPNISRGRCADSSHSGCGLRRTWRSQTIFCCVNSVWASVVGVPREDFHFETPADLVRFLARLATHKVIDAYRQRRAQKNYCEREVPITQTVCDPCTGQTNVVECGYRTETVANGCHSESRLAGYDHETFQCGCLTWRGISRRGPAIPRLRQLKNG